MNKLHKSVLSLILLFVVAFFSFSNVAYAEGGDHNSDKPYDPVATAMHHIADANEIHVFGDFHLPLPVILYAPGEGVGSGWTICSSSKFHHGSYNGYVMDHGRIKRLQDPAMTIEHIDSTTYNDDAKMAYVWSHDKQYQLEAASTADGGIFGGGITSFYDFSITKNVFTMLLATLLLCLIFLSTASAYKKREGQAPKGLQSLMETLFLFIRDNVSRPMIGEKHYERFQPFIMSLFFFILVCNLMGLIPFFPGSANVTGNLGVTMALAIITFIVVSINGNKHYWEHILWMPGIPAWVKIILTPVEIMGMFIKPFSLMIRLFANITAGHIIILSLVGLIFVFGENGQNMGGAFGGGVIGVMFTMFMNIIELIVSFIQAFIFATLTASYIGAAVEEGHDHDHAEAEHH
ncbi:MAG: F0F1 ATP synthase subunit A [Saprospiraceae bacterium]